MTDVEHPEEEQRNEGQEVPAERPAPAPESAAEAPAEPPPAAEAPQPEQSAAEAPPEPPPAAEAPQPQPETSAEQEAPPAPQAAAEQPQPETPAEQAAPPAPEPAAEAPQPETPAEQAAPPAPEPAAEAPQAQEVEVEEVEVEEVELTPRAKPEIPGADLEPDIVPEGSEFIDAEAQAAAEAEAEAAAARDEQLEDEAQPIADAAIDLAAGARYTATGKRKTAVARVILRPGTGTYSINGKPLDTVFPRETLQRMIRQPLETVGYESRMDVVARMHGGGVAAQGGALRHGISRALIVADPNLRGELKRRGFLTRDPRVKERKKAGLKKARKRPQFSKR